MEQKTKVLQQVFLLHSGPGFHCQGSCHSAIVSLLCTLIHMPSNHRPMQNPETLRIMSSCLPPFPHPLQGPWLWKAVDWAVRKYMPTRFFCLPAVPTLEGYHVYCHPMWVPIKEPVTSYETYDLTLVLSVYTWSSSRVLKASSLHVPVRLCPWNALRGRGSCHTVWIRIVYFDWQIYI